MTASPPRCGLRMRRTEDRSAFIDLERLNASLDGIVIGLNRLRLALESGNTLMVRDERVGQDLDRDSAPELRIASAIHLAHAAFTEQHEDFVGAEAVPTATVISPSPFDSPATYCLRGADGVG
jgi:hypothetical protein